MRRGRGYESDNLVIPVTKAACHLWKCPCHTRSISQSVLVGKDQLIHVVIVIAQWHQKYTRTMAAIPSSLPREGLSSPNIIAVLLLTVQGLVGQIT